MINIIYEENIIQYAVKTKDIPNVYVMKCLKSGIIFLNNTSHLSKEYYADMEERGSKDVNQMLKQEGFNTYSNIIELQDNYYDVISLFHVFEHIASSCVLPISAFYNYNKWY
ncbi:hypothetical protein QEJ31_04405 [Pigmentibacter sp. JX0631]|uniref:hypothetical protein n=1 Tax=Pigmentibacter sp. JX0631 TaxID=2976982 RepID=UPI0024697C00|nr:hypothetical protein [Pigmentibacter sp. JX0631]WGL60837.1 hypothetical protein QEJ31_04405 [Pigmentibacter sp. JX0631]